MLGRNLFLLRDSFFRDNPSILNPSILNTRLWGTNNEVLITVGAKIPIIY